MILAHSVTLGTGKQAHLIQVGTGSTSHKLYCDVIMHRAQPIPHIVGTLIITKHADGGPMESEAYTESSLMWFHRNSFERRLGDSVG